MSTKEQSARTGKKKRLLLGRYASPFRYPGGKNWFLPLARKWLIGQGSPPTAIIEPFAGGAGISLTAVRERLVEKAVFAEIDEDVAATWETILNGHAAWLSNEIRTFRVSRERVQAILAQRPSTVHERAFQCLLRNRTTRGGILRKGAGLLRRGEDDRGLRSRWYPEALSKRIEIISNLKGSLRFESKDGFLLIREYLDDPSVVYFVDPPYTKAAPRLYTHWNIGHASLFHLLSQARGDVLMTYDDTDEVRRWAVDAGFEVREIDMRTSHHRGKKELMISRSFHWMS